MWIFYETISPVPFLTILFWKRKIYATKEIFILKLRMGHRLISVRTMSVHDRRLAYVWIFSTVESGHSSQTSLCHVLPPFFLHITQLSRYFLYSAYLSMIFGTGIFFLWKQIRHYDSSRSGSIRKDYRWAWRYFTERVS